MFPNLKNIQDIEIQFPYIRSSSKTVIIYYIHLFIKKYLCYNSNEESSSFKTCIFFYSKITENIFDIWNEKVMKGASNIETEGCRGQQGNSKVKVVSSREIQV